MSGPPTVMRTPDSAFTGLEDLPFRPSYSAVDGGDPGPLRMACIDEGAGTVVRCLHGEPGRSCLYICDEFDGANLSAPELAACRAPCPDNRYKAGARAVPAWMKA